MQLNHCQHHFKTFNKGATWIASVFGPTWDALDVVSVDEDLPIGLRLGDRIYSENIGAHPIGSATNCNRMPLPKVAAVGGRWQPIENLRPTGSRVTYME